MPLRGKTPTHEEQRLKTFNWGPPGCGKTLAALQFPNAYIIDTAKETSRYYKLIQQKNSEVFKCSNPYTVIEELKTLRDEKHKFVTLVLDEATTLYSNLQRSWNDRFIRALETKKSKQKSTNADENLLYDFGPRYWDKVKRDWKYMIDLLLQLDMNVIVNAHSKNKYGESQSIIGVTSASDASDEYVFDFVFHLIKRGQDYKAITEKQRILPVAIDPEAKRFPKEFDWNYDNLLKFYNKEYIERPIDGSTSFPVTPPTAPAPVTPTPPLTVFTPPTTATTPYNLISKDTKKETFNKETIIPDENANTDKPTSNKSDRIKAAIKEAGIPIKDFKLFLQTSCKFGSISALSKLTTKQKNIVLDNWPRILKKYKELNKNTEEKEESNKPLQTGVSDKTIKEVEDKVETNNRAAAEIVFDPKGPIREDQKASLLKSLEKEEIDLQRFFKGFMIKGWEEVNQNSAANMIKNFEVMIGAIE